MKNWFLQILALLVVLALGFFYSTTRVTRSKPASEIYNLSSTQVNELKMSATNEGDAKAAIKLFQYYAFTRNNWNEALKWDQLARELKSKSSGINPCSTNLLNEANKADGAPGTQ